MRGRAGGDPSLAWEQSQPAGLGQLHCVPKSRKRDAVRLDVHVVSGGPAVLVAYATVDPWLCVPGFRRVCLYRSWLSGSFGNVPKATITRPSTWTVESLISTEENHVPSPPTPPPLVPPPPPARAPSCSPQAAEGGARRCGSSVPRTWRRFESAPRHHSDTLPSSDSRAPPALTLDLRRGISAALVALGAERQICCTTRHRPLDGGICQPRRATPRL